MRAVAVLYILGWALATVAAAMLIPASFAVAVDSIAQVQAFVFPAIAVGFLAGGMIISFKSREVFAGRRQSLLLLALVWFVVPIAGALPFYTSGFPGNAIAAYFEAVSGFTTTGATVLTNLSDVPASIIVWRALLQWIGGLATLIALAALLGPLSGSALIDRQLRLIGHSTQGTALHLKEAIRTITPLYTALTIVCFIALSVSGIPAFDAFSLSLSALSTGGFMPRDGTFVLYGAPMAELFLAVFMGIGAISIIWIRAIFQMRWPLVREIREPIWIIWAIGLSGLVLAIGLIVRTGETDLMTLLHSLTLGLASAASIISTSGFAISHQTNALIPFMVLLGVCMIGGGRFSTAGGLKVYRIATMLRQLGREFRLLVYPHGVRPSRHGAESLDSEVIKSAWITLTAFVLIIGTLALIIAWTGVPFSGALLAATGSVSNIGPAYEFARVTDFPNAPTYAQMSPVAQIAISAGMIFGRVEILALLSIFNVIFWRN
ncbi:MAG TPA: TrkH family potassium uptake protein [Rhizobiales bacterium]|nr:trk system potassium uptake protein TrkG [bacterium BMS3Bbin10]HDO52062.1 TrkH family potassium uptake protein [Hyphomicrobiales bacterium]